MTVILCGSSSGCYILVCGIFDHTFAMKQRKGLSTHRLSELKNAGYDFSKHTTRAFSVDTEDCMQNSSTNMYMFQFVKVPSIPSYICLCFKNS